MYLTINLKRMKKYFIFTFLLIIIILIGIISVSWYYPLKYLDIIDANSEKYNIDPALVCAVIHAESKFNNKAISNKGANGLMQIIEQTGNWAASEIGYTDFDYYTQINDPKINIEIGSWYLRRLINQYGSVELALAAYNAGSGNVSKWIKDERYSQDGKTLTSIPFKETTEYLKRVEFNYKIYKVLLSRRN